MLIHEIMACDLVKAISLKLKRRLDCIQTLRPAPDFFAADSLRLSQRQPTPVDEGLGLTSLKKKLL